MRSVKESGDAGQRSPTMLEMSLVGHLVVNVWEIKITKKNVASGSPAYEVSEDQH